MTDTISPAAPAADPARASGASHGAAHEPAHADESHGMRPIAIAFAIGNAAVLAVFGLVVATGHLDAGGLGDILLTTATAAPAN